MEMKKKGASRKKSKKVHESPINRLHLEKIRGKVIRVIGLGGIGSHLVSNLGRFLWSQNAKELDIQLKLMDGDHYEPINQERMSFPLLGGHNNKAIAKAVELADAFGDRLPIRPLNEYLAPENIASVVIDGDILFLAVDNHQTRKLVSDHCEKLDTIVLFNGGNDGVDGNERGTFGNVQIYERREGKDLKNPITRFHPEIEKAEDRAPYDIGCEDLAQGSAPQLLFTNLAVASAMLNTFYAWLLDELPYEEVYLDIVSGMARPCIRELKRRF